MPSFSLPTSDSSTRPLKIMSAMSATAAMVVPGLKLLALMTELPSLTGTVSTMPSTVDSTWVDSAVPFPCPPPPRAPAAPGMRAALLLLDRQLVVRAQLVQLAQRRRALAPSVSARSSSRLARSTSSLAERSRSSASFRLTTSGITCTSPMMSPFFTRWPGSTDSLRRMPEMRGLISISLRGWIVPAATNFLMMSAIDRLLGLDAHRLGPRLLPQEPQASRRTRPTMHERR